MCKAEGFLSFSHEAEWIPLAFYKMDEYNNIKIDNGLPRGSWLFLTVINVVQNFISGGLVLKRYPMKRSYIHNQWGERLGCQVE